MLLSDCEIRELVGRESLIAPFVEENLQAVSYDITMNNVMMACKRVNAPIFLTDNGSVSDMLERVDISNGYLLKPGEYVLVKTKEKLALPKHIAAHIRPRTTFIRYGLLILAQHLQPTFNGYLYLGLYNVTPNVIMLTPGLKIGQVSFENIDGKITDSKLYCNKIDAKFQGEDDFRTPKMDKLTPEEKAEAERIIRKITGE